MMRYSGNHISALTVSTALVSFIVLSGCSTVHSVDVSQAPMAARRGAYLNYSVAKSVFTIQIAAATSDQQTSDDSTTDKTKAADSNTAAATATQTPAATDPAAAPAVAAAPNDVVAAAATPKPSAATKPKATTAAPAGADAATADAATTAATANTPVDTSRCGVLTAQYTAAQTLVAGAITKYIGISQRLSAFAVGHPTAKDTPKALAADINAYIDLVQTDGAYTTLVIQAAGTSIVDHAPGVYDEIVQACQPRLKIKVSQIAVPDTTHSFALKPETNIFYTDSLSFGLDSNGFLTNGAPTSTSNVTDIASAIAQDAGMAAAPLPGAVAGPLAAHELEGHWPPTGHGRTPVVAPKCEAATGASAISSLAKCDWSKPADQVIAAKLAAAILPALPTPGALENLPKTTLPRTIVASLDDFGADGQISGTSPLSDAAAGLRTKFGLVLSIKCSGRTGSGGTAVPENLPSTDTSYVYEGIVVSAPRACELQAVQTRDTHPIIVAQNYFWSQDSRILTILPTSRGFLVKRSVSYTFANGQATGVTDSRPSEALALVSFPGTVIGSFVGGIATGATDRSAKASARTAELTAQTANIQAQASYLAAQAQLTQAKAGNFTTTNTTASQ